MVWLFWGSVVLFVYPYLIYPFVIACWGILRSRPVQRGDIQPTVTVLIPAHNEAAVIAQTLDAMLAQQYPKDRLQILVVSDGSIDGTDDIVRSYTDRGVQLLRQEPRGGKALALNAAIRRATGEIVVFCDANARFAPDAVSQAVRNFADPFVGYVTGCLGLQSDGESLSGSGVSAYIAYENLVRRLETRTGSIIGVNGGVDAIRRALYSDIPGDLITDFVLPLRVIAAGYRVVVDPQMRSSEMANSEVSSEFRMRVRVALRGLQGLAHMRRLLNPLRFPGAAFCLMSHKVLRYLGFVFMATALLANLWLAATAGGAYLVLLGVHLAIYGFALLGVWGRGGAFVRKVSVVPAYLLMSSAAFAVATRRFLAGHTMATWQPRAG
jgi:cellulose synthase/poly-beta-1,6-N-acetylglucosamine synthase-like glycosyltransferase